MYLLRLVKEMSGENLVNLYLNLAVLPVGSECVLLQENTSEPICIVNSDFSDVSSV